MDEELMDKLKKEAEKNQHPTIEKLTTLVTAATIPIGALVYAGMKIRPEVGTHFLASVITSVCVKETNNIDEALEMYRNVGKQVKENIIKMDKLMNR